MLQAGIKNISIISEGKEKSLLNDILFQLEDHKINVILGKNGTGKSTLIKALTRLLDERFYHVEGEVLFNGNDLLTVSQQELLNIRRTKIRYVFQDAINSFDPLRNIGYHFREYEGNPDLKSLIQDFLLPEKKGLFSLFPYEISGGMAQRLLLIHALIARPRILILDEPTSGIDTPISNLILMKLKEFIQSGENSVLLVTQDLQFAKSAGDRIAYLADGILFSFYSTGDFFEKNGTLSLKNFLSAYNQLA